jgi:hypothetical protein
MLRIASSAFICLLMLVPAVLFQGSPVLAGPFGGDVQVEIDPTPDAGVQLSTVESQIEDLQAKGAAGLDKLTQKLDAFIDKIDRLISGSSSSTPAATSSTGSTANQPMVSVQILPGDQPVVTAPSTTSTSSGAGTAFGDAFKKFFSSLGDLVVSVGKYLGALWKEMTGPDKKEAPVANALNSLTTDMRGLQVKWNWQSFLNSGKSLGQTFGAFCNSLFK